MAREKDGTSNGSPSDKEPQRPVHSSPPKEPMAEKIRPIRSFEIPPGKKAMEKAEAVRRARKIARKANEGKQSERRKLDVQPVSSEDFIAERGENILMRLHKSVLNAKTDRGKYVKINIDTGGFVKADTAVEAHELFAAEFPSARSYLARIGMPIRV